MSWGAKGNISRIQLKSALRSEQGACCRPPGPMWTYVSARYDCRCVEKSESRILLGKAKSFFEQYFIVVFFFFKLSSTNSYIIIIGSDILYGHFMSVFNCILENADHRCLKSVWFAYIIGMARLTPVSHFKTHDVVIVWQSSTAFTGLEFWFCCCRSVFQPGLWRPPHDAQCSRLEHWLRARLRLCHSLVCDFGQVPKPVHAGTWCEQDGTQGSAWQVTGVR